MFARTSMYLGSVGLYRLGDWPEATSFRHEGTSRHSACGVCGGGGGALVRSSPRMLYHRSRYPETLSRRCRCVPCSRVILGRDRKADSYMLRCCRCGCPMPMVVARPGLSINIMGHIRACHGCFACAWNCLRHLRISSRTSTRSSPATWTPSWTI